MNLKLSCLLLFITTTFFISCSPEKVMFTNLDALKEQMKIKDFPEQKDYPEADGLVLTEAHNINITTNNNKDTLATNSFYRVIKLFKNIDDFNTIDINVPNGDEISGLHARTISPDGTINELKPEDFHIIVGGGYDFVFYDDDRTVKFSLPTLEKNCIIEYGYTLKDEHPFIMNVWDIQDDIPKLQSIYQITMPANFVKDFSDSSKQSELRYLPHNCKLEKPSFTEIATGSSEKSLSFKWIEKNIPAFEPEQMMPPVLDYLEYVDFAPNNWKTWNDVSEWYYSRFFKPRFIISDSIKSKAVEITKSCDTETEKIRSLYNYIQTFRYVAIKLGKTGLAPALPQKVLEHKYGDCKDKSTLLVSLLKSVGVNAKPVLVLTADEGHINKDFPCLGFNHMIVKATTKDGKDYWMDPTLDHCSLGMLPYQCENIYVLVLNEDGTSSLEKTPNSTYADNVEDIHMKIDLTDKDSTNFEIVITNKGKGNFESRSLLCEKTETEMLKFCKALVSDNYLNAVVSSYTLSNIDSVDNDLVLRFRLKVPNVIEKQGEYSFLNIDPFQFSERMNWLGKDERKYDIEFDNPHTLRKTIDVILPENQYNISGLPSNVDIDEHGLSYSKKYAKINDNTISTTELFVIRDKDIPRNYYKKIGSFFNIVKSKANEKIILTSK